MTIYPYIYCYPWLLEYILHEDNIDVKNFIEYVIGDETKRNFGMQLFSSVNEEKYYRISLESNLEKNIQIASLPYDKLLLQESYNSIYNEDNIKKNLLEKIRIVYIDIEKSSKKKKTTAKKRKRGNSPISTVSPSSPVSKTKKKKKTTAKKRKRGNSSPISAVSPSSPVSKTKKIKKISSPSPKKITKNKSRLPGIKGLKSIYKRITRRL